MIDRPWPTSEWHPSSPEPRAVPHARIPANGYWRPRLGLWQWALVPPEVKALTLWGIAWSATTALAGLRIWRALTEHDETED